MKFPTIITVFDPRAHLLPGDVREPNDIVTDSARTGCHFLLINTIQLKIVMDADDALPS